MASTENLSMQHHRPGGRTARTTARIHDAVLSLLAENGIEGCTFVRVAQRAGVQRSTLYRRFPDRWAMMLEAYTARAQGIVAVEPSGDFVRDFKLLLTRFVENFASPLGAAVMTIVMAVQGTPAERHLRTFIDTRMGQIEPLFAAAVRSGQLDASVDHREVAERAAGAAIFRLFVERRPTDGPWVAKMVADLDRLYRKETAS